VAVDWLRNVLAAGTATIVSHGRLYAVTDPQIVDATTAEPLLPARRRREFRRFGIDRYVRFTLA
ncbi:MAG TPA: nitroreductase, partial [Mycobacterium sp.]|nr:nitroreductase [Mycobacterium sp.]